MFAVFLDTCNVLSSLMTCSVKNSIESGWTHICILWDPYMTEELNPSPLYLILHINTNTVAKAKIENAALSKITEEVRQATNASTNSQIVRYHGKYTYPFILIKTLFPEGRSLIWKICNVVAILELVHASPSGKSAFISLLKGKSYLSG